MQPLLGGVEAVLAASHDHLHAVVDVALAEVHEPQQDRHSAVEDDVVHRYRGFQRSQPA